MNNTKKRILISAISALLCLSLVACGNNKTDDNKDDTTTTTTTTTIAGGDETTSPNEAEDTTTAPVEDKAAVITPDVAADTLGAKLWQAFLTAKEEKPEITAEEMAALLIANEAIPAEVSLATIPIEAGQEFFTGFDNYQIKGYENGALYMPMIGTTPFVGYIFELAEGADVDAFVKDLADNCNLRWNICTAADQSVIGAYNTTVFFVMCPTSFAQ